MKQFVKQLYATTQFRRILLPLQIHSVICVVFHIYTNTGSIISVQLAKKKQYNMKTIQTAQ